MGKSLRARIDEIWLKAIRLYTYNTPLAKGKYRLFLFAMDLCRELPSGLEAPARDGRRFAVNLATGMHTSVFFLGEYESAITKVVSCLVRRGDICLDVGANFGWYTTLFRKLCGPDGEVHSFEPVPTTFRELEHNHRLMGGPANVHLNALALGDHEGEIEMNVFPGLPTGHASVSGQGREDAIVYRTPMTTLHKYLEEHPGEIDLVKVDIEGSELMFLRGARTLFEQERPPVFLMEMALEQTKNFGYLPNDLVKYIGEQAPYDFYVIDEVRGKIRKINGFTRDDIGANVLAVPHARDFSTDLEKFLD